MIGWEEGETARFCFIIALAKVHPLFSGSATRSPMALYLSLFLKGLTYSPRPYAPPVARLSKEQTILSSIHSNTDSRLAMGSYHFEYGFPPTHSANCVHGTIPGRAPPRSPSCWIPLNRNACDLGHRTCVVPLINCGQYLVHGDARIIGRFRQHHPRNYWVGIATHGDATGQAVGHQQRL